jgi:hypothetical protein
MPRFSRAFDGALKNANPPISQADAATLTGYHPSLVSRVLSGRSTLTPEHVSKLLTAVPNKADREYCVSEFLLDCCPEDYREHLTITIGKSAHSKARGSDQLSNDLTTLEKLATDQPELRRLISLLISIVNNADAATTERGASVVERALAATGRATAPTPPKGKHAAAG